MKSLFAFLALLLTTQAYAECVRPEAPVIPDGSTADLATMVEGQKAVKAYVADSEAYLDCLNKEGEASMETESDEEKMARIEEHNSSVDSMEAVANEFNEEIREYKEQNP